jgi:hypothetical protein
MEGIEKPHTDKYKEITNDSNYDVSCTLTSLQVWELQNVKPFIFVAQSVQCSSIYGSIYEAKIENMQLYHVSIISYYLTLSHSNNQLLHLNSISGWWSVMQDFQ